MDRPTERWEPPASTQQPEPRPRGVRPPSPDVRGAWAQAIATCLGRVLVAVLCLLPRLVPVPAVGLVVLGLAVLIAHFVVVYLAWRDGLPDWGMVWLADLLTLGLVAPIVVMHGFLASTTGPLLPAERTAYLETTLAAALALLLATRVALHLDRRMPGMGGVLILPAVLQVPALIAVYDDYRDIQTLGALAIAYAVAAGVTIGAIVLPPNSRRWLAPATWAAFTLVLLVVASGVSTLGARPGVIRGGQIVLLLLAAGCLLVASLGNLPAAPRRRRTAPREV